MTGPEAVVHIKPVGLDNVLDYYVGCETCEP